MGRINTGGVNKRTGDNLATASSVSGTTLKLTPPKGYYDGSTGTVNITDADYLEANIRSGINLFGKAGTLIEGLQTYEGSVATTINVPVTITAPFSFKLAELYLQNAGVASSYVRIVAGFFLGGYSGDTTPLEVNSGNLDYTSHNANSVTVTPKTPSTQLFYRFIK